MTPLTDLIAKVEKLEGPDREVDASLAILAGAQRDDGTPSAFGLRWEPSWWTMPNEPRERWPHRTTPWPFTASLDSALALVERVLPDAEVAIVRLHGWAFWEADLEPPGVRQDDKRHYVDHRGPTPAVALILALLRALEGSQKASVA